MNISSLAETAFHMSVKLDQYMWAVVPSRQAGKC